MPATLIIIQWPGFLVFYRKNEEIRHRRNFLFDEMGGVSIYAIGEYQYLTQKLVWPLNPAQNLDEKKLC